MIERCFRHALLLLSCLLLPLAAVAEEPCRRLTATGNPEYPPYLWRDPQNPQQLIGANADLLKYLGKQLGLEIEVIYGGPWPRAQEEVRTGRIDLMAGYFMTQARQQQMDFITPPFLHTPSVVWVRQDHAFAYHQWADLKGRKGGTLVNNSHGQQFDDFARANLILEAVPSARQAFEKLMHKRSDYVVYEQYPGMALARTLGIASTVQVLEPPISSEGLYLALSHDSSCNRPHLREALAREMEKIVAGALPQQLLQQNLERWQ
ncbi:amino acid ABC transporter substrate-binding protein [Pseudomonas monteilii]|uniref:Amino acid ABC transporter substrate-binding protein n=2 Tax=Pseudomonas TaxID=286 RepID=A0A6G6V0C6_9PSED|nr:MULTISPECIES: transporter substrate-binding domain-containing protein [Pseudomonas]AVH38472.1 amino acid ABC transporter substrate-binding protein [Pseudomonas monteilii]MBA6136896.1 transporter substrate-binding domain-containing protein [Pseudomonas monteilii]MBV4514147.1 transporter substrate-binding domain-containing protein [Pseudomonas kurunegalensis]MBZ3663741.1 transporter substrate-binding domain-containing protein [Pseudomonas monteilii]MBZ3669086.1 transporter substrate-binding d